MLRLTVEIPEARDHAAVATLRDGFTTIVSDAAAASATEAYARMHDNPDCDPLRRWGHPPFGQYVLLNHQPSQADLAREYGHHLLLFQPTSGPALQAESFGRLAMLAYGGPSGADRKMRRTQGGLRLTDHMLNAIVARLKPQDDLMLELKPLRAPAWWRFWKSPAVTQPLSDDLPSAFPPPADEWSLLDALLNISARRVRPVAWNDDDPFDRDRRDTRGNSSSDSASETFQGKGGESGGGGASGSWDTPGRSSAPGVDSSGRVIGAAAAIGAMAGATMASRNDEGDGSSAGEPGSGANTSTSTSY